MCSGCRPQSFGSDSRRLVGTFEAQTIEPVVLLAGEWTNDAPCIVSCHFKLSKAGLLAVDTNVTVRYVKAEKLERRTLLGQFVEHSKQLIAACLLNRSS